MFGFGGAAMLDSRKRDKVEVTLNLCGYRMRIPSLGKRKARKIVRIEGVKTKSRGWVVGCGDPG